MAYKRKTPPYKWVIMIYAVANDNPSDKAMPKFLAELNKIGKKLDAQGKHAKVKIFLLVHCNLAPRKKRKRYYTAGYELQNNFHKNPLWFGVVNENMGDSETLTEFMLKCDESLSFSYPHSYHNMSEKYMLLLWGHGSGSGMFHNKLIEDLTNIDKPEHIIKVMELVSKKYQDDQLHDDDIFFGGGTKALEFFLNISKHKELLNDLPSRPRLDALTVKEISKSLRAWIKHSRRKLDMLVLMGCANQMVEFGYEIRKYCNHLVASEELIYFDGYNYLKTFSELIKKPDLDALEISKIIIKDTKSMYEKMKTEDVAVSAVDLGKNEKLAEMIDAISNDLLKNFSSLKNHIFLARFECFHLGQRNYDSYIDIVWFLKRLGHWLKNTRHIRLLGKIDATIKFLDNDYIISRYIGAQETKVDKNGASIGAHGVSIYFPVSHQDHEDNELLRLPFSNQSKYKLNFIRKNWDDMVRRTWKYLEVDLQLFYPKL